MPTALIDSIVPTISGQFLAAHQRLNRPYVPKINSTLNQLYSIHHGVMIPTTAVFGLNYLVFGIGGISVVPMPGGRLLHQRRPHRPRDAGLFDHIPVCVRQPGNYLNDLERAHYRLRRIESIGGVDCEVYYALNIGSLTADIEQRIVTPSNSLVFEHVASDLTPTPPVINTDGTVNTSGSNFSITAVQTVTLNQWMIHEILNAVAAKLGNAELAFISEIGICSGVDQIVPGTFGASTQNYTDALGMQIYAHLGTKAALSYEDTHYGFNLNYGSQNPMLDF